MNKKHFEKQPQLHSQQIQIHSILNKSKSITILETIFLKKKQTN
jgi:hypothetical protein